MLRLQSALALRTRYNNKRIVLQREVEVVHGRTSLLLTHQPSRGFVAMIARGGAGVVAALGIVYIAYEAAIRLEMTQMRSIRKAIYKPQAELMSFNPGSLFLPRPDKTAFLAEVFSADPSGPILITGPQGSGKTAAIKQVLKGRFQTVYLDLRAQPVTTGEALTLAFVEQAGFLMPPRELVGRAVFAASATSSQTASFEIEKAFRLIREVLRADKASGLRGWISPGSNGQPVITPPLLCIDELNVSDVSALSEDPAFWRFIEWSLYITDNRLANVAISCSTEVAEMLDAHPGFRARRHRIFFDFPRAKSVASYFKNVVNTQLRDVCGAAPRPGGPMAKAISEAAAAKAKAAAIAAAEAAAASEQAAASARANINSDAANNEELNNGKSSSHSLTTTLWTFLFGSPNKTTADSSVNSSTKGDNMIDHLLSKKTASSTSEGRSVDSPASISATTVSAPQSSVISSTGTLSSLLSPAAITAAVTSSSTVLQGVQGSGQGSSPTLSTSASEPATDKLPSTPPTLTMVAQLEGEGPSAAFSFARAAALAAQTERDKSAAAAAAVAASATVSTSASTLAAPVIAEAASVAIASTGAGPLPLPMSPTEATNVISLQSSSSSQSKEVATLNTSSASSLTSNDGINVVTIPDYQQHPHITPQVVTMLSIKDLDTKNVSMTTKTTSSGSSGNNTTTAADATQSLVKESVSSRHLDVGGGTSLTSIDRSAILTSTTQPSVTRPSNVTAAPHTSLNNHSSNVITTHEPSQTALSISSSLITATTPTTAAASSSAVINPDRLNQSSLVNYFVYGSRYEFAPWGRTQSRYYLLEDHEIARIVETIGGNLKDLHTVVASIMSGKHWASALERLVADSADMVESTLDVLLAASTSDSTSSTSSASPGGGGAVSSATGGAAPGAVNLSVAGGGGGNRAGGGGRRGLRLRLLARAPMPQWDFAANPRPDRLAAYSRFLRAWDLMIELERRKYVQRRELVDSIFAGCPHELEYLVDVGLAVAVNIKGMTRVANGGSSAQAQVAIEQFGLGKDGAVVTKVPGVYIAAASPRLRMAFRSLTRDALLVRHAARVRASVRLAHLRIEEARISNKMMPDATAERSYWHGQVQQLLVRDTTLRSAVARELIALQAAAPVTAVDFLTKGTMTPEALKEGEGAPLSITEEISGTNLRGNDKNTHTTQTIVSGRDGGAETSPLLHLNSASSSAPLPPPFSPPPPPPSSSSSTLRNWSFRDDPLNGVSEVPLLGASALSGQLEVALQSMREAENEVRSLRSRLTEIRTEIANEESKVRIMYEAVQLDSSTLTKASSASSSSSSFVDRPDRDLAVSWVLDGGFVPTNGGMFPSSPVATSTNSAASVSSATPSSVSSANALNGDTHMTTISSPEGGLSTMSGKGVLNETSSSPVASSASSKLSSTSSSSLSSMSFSSPSSSNPSALSTTNSAISDDAPSTTPFTSASSGYYGSYQFLSEDKEEEEDDDDEEDSEEEEEAGGAAWAARRQNKQAARQQQKQERDSNITSSSSSTNPFGPTRRNFDRTEGEGSSSAIKPVKKQKTARTGSTKGAGEAQRKLGYSGWYRANDRDER